MSHSEDSPPPPDLPPSAESEAEVPAESAEPAAVVAGPAQPLPRGPSPASQATVLQPLTPLRDVSIPQRPLLPEDDWRLLGTWSAAMQRALNEDRPGDAVLLSHVVLRQLPRHLATYLRLIRAAWMLRRWEEGDSWGRRLLRADPSNALAWRAVAMASEQRSERSRSHARWQRAFESDPYEPEIRAGLVRTSVDLARLPALNDSCLATLYLRGMRWEQAAELFAALAERDNRRTDYQIGQLLALWQLGLNEQAYELAGRLTQTQPYLLYAWIVTDATGDANDQALARHPLTTMDPDGDYLRLSTGLAAPAKQVRLNLTEADKEVLERVLPEAESLQADD